MKNGNLVSRTMRHEVRKLLAQDVIDKKDANERYQITNKDLQPIHSRSSAAKKKSLHIKLH
jgi:predicted transcriptional regulator